MIQLPECAFFRVKMGFFFLADHRAMDPSYEPVKKWSASTAFTTSIE